ncbi:unnamed protein product [Effrenium voratum]|nr:unnamed protein product [Effrenium voratum]
MGSVIAAQLFGHVHRDEVRLLPNPPPGAGPIFFNNPCIKTVSYDEDTGEFLDFDVFYTRISNVSASNWEFGYRFKDLYQLQDLSMQSLYQLASQLSKGESAWKSYAQWYTTSYPNDLQSYAKNTSDSPEEAAKKSFRRHQYLCGITLWSANGYQDCVDSFAFAGPRVPVKQLVGAIPRNDLDDEQQMILARLLRWAELAYTSDAARIIAWGGQHRWKDILEKYGPVVQHSREAGFSLDELFASQE